MTNRVRNRSTNIFSKLHKVQMKKIVVLLIICLVSISAIAQTSVTPVQNISSDINTTYRLFATKNIYTFLKLDTRNGKIWQVQWGTEKNSNSVTTLSDTPLVNKDEEKTGRFFLYPTTNIYNFILLDQVDGRIWQVQWGEEKFRLVIRID